MQVKFAKMLTPNQIRKIILYVWQRILFCKKYWIDWDLEIATHTHWKRENPDATPLDNFMLPLKQDLLCGFETYFVLCFGTDWFLQNANITQKQTTQIYEIKLPFYFKPPLSSNGQGIFTK